MLNCTLIIIRTAFFTLRCLWPFALSVVVFNSGMAQEVSPDPDHVIETTRSLQSLIEVRRANRERIVRWEGEVEMVAVLREPQVTITRTANVRFAYDRNRNAQQYFYKIVGWESDPESSTMFVRQTGHTTGELHLDSLAYNLRLDDWASRETDSVIAYQRTTPTVNFVGTQFFPLHFMGIQYDPEDSMIEMWLKYLGPGFEWFSITVEKQVDGQIRVTPRNTSIPIDVSWIGFFDLNQGGNILHSEQDVSDRESSRYDVVYQEIDGIFVPKLWHYRLDRRKKGTGREIIVRFVRQTVNRELPANAFTLEFMGVRPGSKLTDHATGSVTTYEPRVEASAQNAINAPVDDAMPSPRKDAQSSAKETRGNSSTIFFIAGFCLLVVMTIAALSRSKVMNR